MNSVLGRAVSADVIRQIWATLKFCHSSSVPASHATLVSQLSQSCGWAVDEAELRVQQSLEAGVVQRKIDSNSGQEVICLPDEAPDVSFWLLLLIF